MLVLITGPVRSGKSKRGVRLARDFGRPVTFVMTARLDPSDAEMAARVARHRVERGAQAVLELWTSGVPDLPEVVAAAAPDTTLLVDSLGTWLAGHLFALEALTASDPVAAETRLEALVEPLVAALRGAACHVVLVAEETGWGIVPMSAQGRLFRDVVGRTVQRIAADADRVELVVAGFALDLRRWAVPVDR